MEKLNRAQKCSILGPQNLGPPGSAPGLQPQVPFVGPMILLFWISRGVSSWFQSQSGQPY